MGRTFPLASAGVAAVSRAFVANYEADEKPPVRRWRWFRTTTHDDPRRELFGCGLGAGANLGVEFCQQDLLVAKTRLNR